MRKFLLIFLALVVPMLFYLESNDELREQLSLFIEYNFTPDESISELELDTELYPNTEELFDDVFSQITKGTDINSNTKIYLHDNILVVFYQEGKYHLYQYEMTYQKDNTYYNTIECYNESVTNDECILIEGGERREYMLIENLYSNVSNSFSELDSLLRHVEIDELYPSLIPENAEAYEMEILYVVLENQFENNTVLLEDNKIYIDEDNHLVETGSIQLSDTYLLIELTIEHSEGMNQYIIYLD